ncbi:karyogamy protein [Scheffersomyces coipomensis]|uniref:karyogamy protein n=1 Tax=Scheffersomyces coipomensis TaxID=1788519 RepID=UPI00315C71AE
MSPLTLNDIRLSELLQTVPTFSFFEELISIPAVNTQLSSSDLYKFNKILSDIIVYLRDLLEIFHQINQSDLSLNNDLQWYFEGKDAILDLDRNLKSIDEIIMQLLSVVESDGRDNVISLLDKFEESNGLLLEVKKFVITFKKSLDLSIVYREIIDTIKILTEETEDCLKSIVRLSKTKISSPNRVLPKFELETIISKMRITNLFSLNNLSMRSIRLPTFNDDDESLYQEYLQLESRVDPLHISLDIIPLKVEDFNKLCVANNSFSKSKQHLFKTYEKLQDRWLHLKSQQKILKKHSLDSKWSEVFQYLIKEIIVKCDFITDELSRNTINDDIVSSYKLCSNSIILINKAFQESILSEQEMKYLFNEKLLPKWQTVNETLVEKSFDPSSAGIPSYAADVPTPKPNQQFDENGLKIFQTKRSRNVSGSSLSSVNLNNDIGLGVNLCIGIHQATTSVPFSIRKEDRVKDFFSHEHHPPPTTRNIRDSLLSLNDFDIFQDTEADDDEKTLVSKTPRISSGFDNLHQEIQKLRISDKNVSRSSTSSHFTSSKRSIKPTKLPKIVHNYIELGYPILKKRLITVKPKTRIASISISHPIFHSPDRQGNRHSNYTSPMVLQVQKGRLNATRLGSPVRGARVVSGEILTENLNVFRKPSRNAAATNTIRSRSSSVGSAKGGNISSLQTMKIPNLTYTSPPAQFNSTSPERPSSSLGSRFDDEHLLQTTTKNVKSKWK